MIEYIVANSKEEFNAARQLFNEYKTSINIDLTFQRFENEVIELEKIYVAPHGGIILGKNEHGYIGCIGIRELAEDVCEFKRMYVKPEFQNFGVGKTLLEHALKLAMKYKYNFVRLDTLNYMNAAMHLYKLFDFYEISPYNHNPNATAVFFEKDIREK